LYASGENDRWSSHVNINKKELQEIQETYPGTNVCAVKNWNLFNDLYYSVPKDDGTEVEFYSNARIGITSDFFSIFNPETVTGDAKKMFSEPNKAVITKGYAKTFFGNENPVGKIINTRQLHYAGRDRTLSIVAVWEDFPANCSLKNGLYYDIGEDPAQDGCDAVFMKTAKFNKSALKSLEQRMARGDHYTGEKREQLRKMFVNRSVRLIPVTKIHFSKMGEGNLTTVLSLLFVGLIALIIAYINFINFSIAMAPSRIKSLNVQKIFGAGNGILRFIVASESVMFSLIAFFVALFCVYTIRENLPRDLFVDISLTHNWQMLAVMGVVSVLLGFVTGLYPAYYVTSFKPVLSLSGNPGKSKRSASLKNVLMSIQFTIAIALITVIVFMKQQHNYAVNYSYGIETKLIACISTFNLDRNPELVRAFAEELKNNPQISDYATGSVLIGQGAGGRTMSAIIEDIKVDFYQYSVGLNFLKFFGIPLIAGVDFPDSKSSSARQWIVNREFGKDLGKSASEVVGMFVGGDEIVGVIDFNLEDLHYPARPAIFRYEGAGMDFRHGWLFLKLADDNIPQTVQYIRDVSKKYSNRPIGLSFLDSLIAGLYKRENMLINLLTIICIITIIIAIMGVYGLITFNIRQKEKEIALRKISGATVWDILLLLNRGVLIQLIIAFAVAAPVAYYIANRWLETFAYKISLQWWVFVLCWLLMVAITVATVCMQTYRAAIRNPVEALKTE
jgi:putative ABC transport system permease protein